jgi:hemoglobin/transferrin/lactoferrin receptor protein
MHRRGAAWQIQIAFRVIVGSAVAAGLPAATIALSGQAYAQGAAPLPPITVEGQAPKAKRKTQAKAPAPKTEPPPAPPPAEAAPQTQAAREQAQRDVPYQTPAAVSTATRSDIERFGQINTGDVLRAMPGTYTRESPQNAGLAVNIRGFEGSGRVNMMIDGVRQNFRFTTHEAQGFTYVDPALVAGIDVARGAVSTVGGAGALVGYANVRTLDVEDVIRPGQKAGALSTITYGTNGVGFQEMGAAAVTDGRVGIIGAISHREPNNYKNGDGVEVPLTHQDLTSGLVKMNFALSSEQMLRIGAHLYENDFFANSYVQNVERETYTLGYTYRPHNNPWVDFAFNAYSNRLRMEYFHDATPTAVTPADPPGTPPLGSAAGRVAIDSGKGFDVSNTSRFSLGAVRVTATYGYEHFFDDVHTFNVLRPAAEGGVNPSGESTIAGAFSQTTFSYGIFDLIAGLRYDTYQLDGTFTAAANNPLGLAPGSYDLDQSEGRANPKITLAAQVLPWLQPYVSYGEAFRAPTINETMLGGNHPSAGVQFFPNPFLEPEIQRGWEFGANIRKDRLFTPNDQFRFKAVYFDMDVENYVTGFLAPPLQGSQQPRGVFINVPGESQVRGVELQGTYDTGGAFVGLSYTYTDIDLSPQQGGLGAPSYLPEHIVVGTAGLRFFDQRLTVGARVTYTSESDVGTINLISKTNPNGLYASRFMPDYTLVDLFTSYKFSETFQVGATVTNLFDVDYTPALSTPFNAPGCFGGNRPDCQDTGRGRTVLFTAKTQF